MKKQIQNKTINVLDLLQVNHIPYTKEGSHVKIAAGGKILSILLAPEHESETHIIYTVNGLLKTFATKPDKFIKRLLDLNQQPEEEWRPVVGYEGLYEVSNLGKVRSLNFRRSGEMKELKLSNSNGYRVLNLSNSAGKKVVKVHRMVAEAFIPNPEGKPHVDHKNNTPFDNRVENLRWVTQRENCQNLHENKTGESTSPFVGVRFHTQRKKFHAQISLEGISQHIGYFESDAEAAKAYDKVLIENGHQAVNFTDFDYTTYEIPKPVFSSKYKGVSLSNGKYRVQFQVNGKVRHFGTFKNEKDAAVTVDIEKLWIGQDPVNIIKPEVKPLFKTLKKGVMAGLLSRTKLN